MSQLEIFRLTYLKEIKTCLFIPSDFQKHTKVEFYQSPTR